MISAYGTKRKSRCPLTGVHRKWLADRQTDAIDPNRASPDFQYRYFSPYDAHWEE